MTELEVGLLDLLLQLQLGSILEAEEGCLLARVCI